MLNTSRNAPGQNDPDTLQTSLEPPQSLETVRITSLPATVYYIPNFITNEEEVILQQKVVAKEKKLFLLGFWLTLISTRLIVRQFHDGSNWVIAVYRRGLLTSQRTHYLRRLYRNGWYSRSFQGSYLYQYLYLMNQHRDTSSHKVLIEPPIMFLSMNICLVRVSCRIKMVLHIIPLCVQWVLDQACA